MHKLLFPAMALMVLGSCASTASRSDEIRVREPVGECDASGVQGNVGERATTRLGTELLAATGAAQLRWVPPRTAVTMDFRPDRLTVSYDDDMLVERISCG